MLRAIFIFLLFLLGIAGVGLGAGWALLHRADIPYAQLEAKYGATDSQYVDLGQGVRMHYRVSGPRAAPVLLLVHGFSASTHTWDAWADLLDRSYRVVRVDLPGHGLTRAPASYHGGVNAYRDTLQAFVESQKLGAFVLVGSSMGGNVAWRYALAHPENIAGLVLVDAAGWPDLRAGTNNLSVFQLLRNPVLGPILRDLDSRALTRQGLRAAFADPSLASEEMVQRYTELSRAPGHRQQLIDNSLGYRNGDYATSEKLAGIAAPTLILHGDRDLLVPLAAAQLFHGAIAGSRLVIYSGIGHLPQEEAPSRSAQDVSEFAAGVFARPPVPALALARAP